MRPLGSISVGGKIPRRELYVMDKGETGWAASFSRLGGGVASQRASRAPKGELGHHVALVSELGAPGARAGGF